MINLEPIAYFISSATEKADVPRQGALANENRGVIRFKSGLNFEQALEDLKGMERIWILFWMDRVSNWKLKVRTPRLIQKKGVFATRSPHRPNPIGLSCVRLISISGLDLIIENHDLLDGSPILDIKPYIEYADSFPGAASGWMQQEGALRRNQVEFSSLALRELLFIEEEGWGDLRSKLKYRLETFLEPSSSNRIKTLEGDLFVQAYKSWRCIFKKIQKDVELTEIVVLAVLSGYDEKSQEIPSKDFLLHGRFQSQFGKENREAFCRGAFFDKLLGIIPSIAYGS